ncbi:hypothetical protein [Urbifossiella limnaea]|uniref:Uncharacterized protein n=1 Tax=Urbifossiella limnaea TaxID=2528023 RepID=A0A517XXH8_9BACT|nr:hypothetical protein [Urbifossiella limnaea]QDU22195.1 hypothetical protein ETAA1_41710 [Urbifossiella limnaea]
MEFFRRSSPPPPPDPRWSRAMELFRAGDAAFVDAVRGIHESKALAVFAETWYSDPRIEARRLLHRYLLLPLTVAAHKPLVKRVFKFAEAAGDDATMARYLVAFDRSVRRGPRRPDAEPPAVLFTSQTRNYLRRRAWRYFRKLGRVAPERFLPAVCYALKQYTDADVPDGRALLDNWGLVHVLFHFSPALEAKPTGWRLVGNTTLSKLQPEPMFRKLWLKSPEPAFELLTANCGTVRQWAIAWLRKNAPDRLTRVSLEELLRWLELPFPELNDLAADLIEKVPGLDAIPVARWLAILDAAKPEVLDRVAGLMLRVLKPAKVDFADAIRLAMARPIPVARLGQYLLADKRPTTPDEVRAVFGLRDAEAEPLRPALVSWACLVLGERPDFQPTWVLEFLDARHEDVREAGWEWLQTDDRARESAVVWQRLLESPHDNIRLRLVAMLEERSREAGAIDALPADRVRFLWAAVLLNVSRGGRAKPFVVRQILDRLGKKPDEAGVLLPIVAAALRSVRGPEFRAGLAGVAGFVARFPQHRPLIETTFPELTLGG